MNTGTVDDAWTAAERFMSLAEELLRLADGGSLYDHRKQTAALRRASMELTRALSDMRRPS